MKSRAKKIGCAFLALAGIALALVVLLAFISRNAVPVVAQGIEVPLPVPIALPADTSDPVTLGLLKFGIELPIDPVGVTDQNAMEVPASPDRVGWYKFGPRPGEEGSAVLAGHVNWSHGGPAVFADLHLLQEGDIVTVTSKNGTVSYFLVTETRRYRQNDDASDVFSYGGGSRIALITCDGEWDKQARTRAKRLVVFATKL